MIGSSNMRYSQQSGLWILQATVHDAGTITCTAVLGIHIDRYCAITRTCIVFQGRCTVTYNALLNRYHNLSKVLDRHYHL